MLEGLWEALAPFLTQDWLAVTRDLPQIFVSGLASGFLYALIAFGFVLIYRATETVNFAQGDIMMVAMFVALALQNTGLPWYVNIAAAIAIVGLFGVVLDLALFRHMAGQSPLATVIITIALGFILRNGVDVVFAPEQYNLFNPAGDTTLWFLGASILKYHLWMIAGALILVGGLFYFLSRTRWGIAIQASSQNQLAAYYQGINVRALNTLVWGLAASVSAFAGIMFGMSKSFSSSVGLSLSGGIMAYAAAIIGGLGSLQGAVIAALMLGVAEQFIKTLSGVHPLINANAGLIFLLVMIALKPKGLFSQLQDKKV